MKEQTIAGDTSQDSKQAVESSPIVVTEDNFPQAYKNMRFDAIIKKAGGAINSKKWVQHPVILRSNLLYA